MTHPLIIVTLIFVLPLCTADLTMQFDGENGVFRILLKRIGELEENVRKSDRKLEEIPVLRMRLDDAEKRLSHMQDLQYRLEKSEEKINELENRVNKKNCDECHDSSNSSIISISESNATKEARAVDSVSGNAWVPINQAEKSGNVDKIVLLNNNRTPGAIMTKENIERRSIPSKVAFTALFSSNPIQLTPGRSLLFDRVDYNEGNAYDKTSGIMTCPISGTYFFYTNILNAPDAVSATEIVHEGIGKGRTFGDSRYDQGSFSATLYCRAGERVWVRVSYGSKIFGGDHSSFTGFLLWADTSLSN